MSNLQQEETRHRLILTSEPKICQAKAALIDYAKGNSSVLEVWLFGSRICGMPKAGSDLDVGMELDPSTMPEGWTATTTWRVEHERFQLEIQPLVAFTLHHVHWYRKWYDPELMESVRKGWLIFERPRKEI